MEFKDTPFWAYVRKSIRKYVAWIEEVKTENAYLVSVGKHGIDAMAEYADTDSHEVFSTMRAAVRFSQCTGAEYREALALMRIADDEYRRELMRIELEHSGEIQKCDIVHSVLGAAANKYNISLNEGKECNFDICEEATRALLYLEDLGVITRKEYMDAGHTLYEMDMEFCKTFKWR